MAGAMSAVVAVVKMQGPKTFTKNIVGTHNEDQLQKLFNKECNKRHNRRSDVKKTSNSN